jgi:hypothetical protein
MVRKIPKRSEAISLWEREELRRVADILVTLYHVHNQFGPSREFKILDKGDVATLTHGFGVPLLE